MNKYLQSCKSEFWSKVFGAELEYTLSELEGAVDVLSVGCGPAVIEADLAEHGFNVTGLDISEEALNLAPDSVRAVAGSAENMPFTDTSFDAVIYIASMQFIEDYRQAIKEAARVLRKDGRILVMLLNTESDFFKSKRSNPASYVNKIRHTNLKEIEKTISGYFSVQTEYFLGIEDEEIFQSSDSSLAGLYVVKGKKVASLNKV
ncbi:MAG: class I SAM-dependent methyltransferase [Sedimentisphaerales bacterium]|nr:class I SAM-dependent methyltransferase [Sedimentisphaerales bacterium]